MKTRTNLACILMISILGLTGDVLGARAGGTTMTLTLDGVTTEVLAWSWGASSSQSFQNGGQGPGNTNFQDISITRFTDALSPNLLLQLANGAPFESAVLQSGPMTITISPVLVTSLSTGAAGKDPLTENVTLNFGRVFFLSDGVEECVSNVESFPC